MNEIVFALVVGFLAGALDHVLVRGLNKQHCAVPFPDGFGPVAFHSIQACHRAFNGGIVQLALDLADLVAGLHPAVSARDHLADQAAVGCGYGNGLPGHYLAVVGQFSLSKCRASDGHAQDQYQQ